MVKDPPLLTKMMHFLMQRITMKQVRNYIPTHTTTTKVNFFFPGNLANFIHLAACRVATGHVKEDKWHGPVRTIYWKIAFQPDFIPCPSWTLLVQD